MICDRVRDDAAGFRAAVHSGDSAPSVPRGGARTARRRAGLVADLTISSG